MDKLNKEAYKRYFFYGDENPEGALEGILFFTWANDLDKNDEMTGEQIIEELVQKTKQVYKQYYRFIELNNKSKIYNIYKQENEKEIENRIRNKIKQLRESDEIITEEQICGKIEKIVQEKKKKGQYVNDDEKKKIEMSVREKFEKRRTKKLIVKDNAVNYSIMQRLKYAHFPEGSVRKVEHFTRYPQYVSYDRNMWQEEGTLVRKQANKEQLLKEQNQQTEYIDQILRHWTEDLYDILKFLDGTEKRTQRYILIYGLEQD